jgi:hypothetical protein
MFDWFSQYTYTQGNPVGFWDPDGARSEAVATGINVASAVLSAVTLVSAIATGAGPLAIGLAVGGLIISGARLANDAGAFDGALALPALGVPPAGGNIELGAPATLELFRTDPCNSQCAAPPIPDEPWASSGASLVTPMRGSSAIGQIAPSFRAPAPTGCSPSTLAGNLDVSWTLLPLLALQIILGAMLLGRRRQRG